MKYALASAISAALLSSAAAQTTTTCNKIGETLYCNSASQQPGPTLQEKLNAIPHPTSRSFTASDSSAMMERHRQMEGASLHRTVGQMVAAGQCSDARATALNAGDFALAREINSMCQTPR